MTNDIHVSSIAEKLSWHRCLWTKSLERRGAPVTFSGRCAVEMRWKCWMILDVHLDVQVKLELQAARFKTEDTRNLLFYAG